MTQNGIDWLQPTLIGKRVLLRPLQLEDFDRLYEAARDPRIWEGHPQSTRWQLDSFKKFFDGALRSKGALIFQDPDSGDVIGSSRYYDLDLAKSRVVIGYTFLVRSKWGTGANREAKSLMVEHAKKWVHSVEFHVHPENLRSQRSLLRLGAVQVRQDWIESEPGVKEARLVFQFRDLADNQ